MKKYLAILLILTTILIANLCLADVYPEQILFRDVPWGASYTDADEILSSGGVSIRTIDSKKYWYGVKEQMRTSLGDYICKGEIGFYAYPYSTSGIKIAGYNITDLTTYFVYVPGENGVLIKDTEHSTLVYARYILEPTNIEGVYADLLAKLTSIYGDVDGHEKWGSTIDYEQNLWYGAEGTMVSLVKQVYSSGSRYIYIDYGYSGADDRIYEAFDALKLEEVLNAGSYTDGL